jgi:peroxiredoxin
VLVIDVLENRQDTEKYAERSKFTFPVLLDSDGAVAASYAPEGVLPDIPREQVPIASNLIIDAQGAIRFYSLLDTTSFDAKLVTLKGRLEEMLGNQGEGAD